MFSCMAIEDAADGLCLPASSRRSACPMADSPGQTVRQVRHARNSVHCKNFSLQEGVLHTVEVQAGLITTTAASASYCSKPWPRRLPY